MRKLNLIKLNEKDNFLTAFAKGGAEGLLVSGAITGIAFIVGKAIQIKNEKSSVEEILENVGEITEK